MLAELLEEEVLRSSAKCIGKHVLVYGSLVCNGDTRVVFVKSGRINAGFCSRLKKYDITAYKIRFLRTKHCETHKQRVYASREFAAEGKCRVLLWQ